MDILRGILFLLSTLGWCTFVKKKTKINGEFAPFFVLALQVMVLFISGLLNALLLASITLFGVGIIQLIHYITIGIKTKDYSIFSEYMSSGYLFQAIMLVLSYIVLRNQKFYHYDNFSHWALVVKGMLENNRFPNFMVELIEFKTYPLGTASFIYYFSSIVGKKEGLQMLAQVYMMLVCIQPFFSIIDIDNEVKDGKYGSLIKKIEAIIIYVICTHIIFNFVSGNTIHDLLVDTLLPLAGTALLFIVYCLTVKKNYILRVAEVDKTSNLLEFLVISSFVLVLQIKNSGIFFAALASLWLLLNLRGDKSKTKKEKISTVCMAVIPYLSLWLWKRHYLYVFEDAINSKHTMDIKQYFFLLGYKTSENISNTASGVLSASISGERLYAVLGLVLAVLIISIITKSSGKIKYLGMIIVLYVSYQFGVFYMYVFSMPEYEAVNLNGFERYRDSILISIMIISLAYFFKCICGIKKDKKGTIKTIISLTLILVSITYIWIRGCNCETIYNTVQSEHNNRFELCRTWLEENIEEYSVEKEKSYYCVLPEKDSGYMYYLIKYLLDSNKSVSKVIKNGIGEIEGYDYMFIYDDKNEIVDEWVKENYPDQYGNSVIVLENAE